MACMIFNVSSVGKMGVVYVEFDIFDLSSESALYLRINCGGRFKENF